MTDRIVARWQDWDGVGLEHLVLKEDPAGIRAESAILATVDGEAIAVRYRILCDAAWRVRKAEIARVGDDRVIEFVGDGAGNWTDGAGVSQPQLQGAIDIDISVTPFTNTLPIRRLALKVGQSAEILGRLCPVAEPRSHYRSAALYPPRWGPLPIRVGRQRLHPRYRGRRPWPRDHVPGLVSAGPLEPHCPAPPNS
jgi:hypothetical protein